MKKAFAYFFLFFFALASFQQATICVTYVLNKNTIIEKFCVNKDKPVMKCEGKCHLKTTLEKTQNSNDQAPINIEQHFFLPVFFEKEVLISKVKIIFKNTYYIADEDAISSYISFVFHPPPVVLFS